ncbi:hypothetical protein ACFO0N_21725 [Halobium salinum]|uniref:Uncharacterized protein n=1 Tax=Halobium salinum TaxID=1364940 RepID=A0ABD5PJK3_9EURY|nr:hypothetical protein [Halobium salinum]
MITNTFGTLVVPITFGEHGLFGKCGLFRKYSLFGGRVTSNVSEEDPINAESLRQQTATAAVDSSAVGGVDFLSGSWLPCHLSAQPIPISTRDISANRTGSRCGETHILHRAE